MSTLHRIHLLRITGCSDGQLWYSHLVGQLVPHLGFSAADGFRSREPNGYVNFVRVQDATPVAVIVGPDQLGRWPFDCARKLVEVKPRPANLEHKETAASALLCRGGHCDRRGVCQSLPDCMHPATEREAAAAVAPTGQSRRHSAIEAAVNIAVGFVVSLGITAVVMPMFGHDVTASQNVAITSIFTVASLLRSYALRRAFNRWSA